MSTLVTWRDRSAISCEWAARISVLSLTILLPWCFGGVDPLSQVVMFAFLIFAECCSLIAALLARSPRRLFPWVSIPIIGALALAFAQTVDLENEQLAALSPKAAQLRQDFRAGPEELSVTAVPQIGSHDSALSVYVPATRKEAALLFCGLIVLLQGFQLFSQPKPLLWLAGSLVLNGAAVAYFGIVQQLSWNGLLYWTIPIEGTTPFGPFINRNGAGGYLVLCLSGAIPLVTWALTRNAPAAAPVDMRRRTIRSHPVRSPSFRLRRPTALMFTGLILAGLLTSGVIMAMSRGAWLAAVTATAITLPVVGRGRIRIGTLLPVCAVFLMACGLLAWLSLTGQVGERMATVTGPDRSLGGRMDLWKDAMLMMPDFARTGSGLGTFGLMLPQYQTQPMLVWFDQAENLYIAALTELGAPGLVLLLLTVVLSVISLIPLLRYGTDPLSTAFAGMAVFAICSQAVAAFFDFSLRYPANQFPLALVVGGTIGLSRQVRLQSAPALQTSFHWPGRLTALVVHAVILAGLSVAWWEMSWAGGVEIALNRGQTNIDEAQIPESEVADTLQGLDLLLERRADDAEGHLRYAAMQVIKYRQAAFKQLQEELGSEMDEADLWKFTSPMVLHSRATEFALQHDTAQLEELRSTDIIRENLEPALRHALLARAHGPLLFKAHQLIGQLWFLVGDPLEDESHISRAVRLRPQDPQVRYWAGEMHLHSQRLPAACAHWRRCLELSGNFDADILERGLPRLPVKQFVGEVLPDDAAVIVRIADRLGPQPPQSELPRLLGEKLLISLDQNPSATPYLKARGYQLVGKPDLSLPLFELATAASPSNVDWRLNMARVLHELGQTRQAVREAELCLRLSENHPEAQALLQQLVKADLQRKSASTGGE